MIKPSSFKLTQLICHVCTFVCDVNWCFYCEIRGIVFFFKIAAPYVCRGCALFMYSAVLRHTVKIKLDRHSLKLFQMTSTLSEGQLIVQNKPFLRVSLAIFACYVIKCKQSISAERYDSRVHVFTQ